jgi:predicted DNA-binding protein
MQIDIPKELEKVLVKISKKLGQEPSNVALSALQDYLEDQEDYHAGVEGWKSYIASGCKGTSLEEMRKKLGLERD